MKGEHTVRCGCVVLAVSVHFANNFFHATAAHIQRFRRPSLSWFRDFVVMIWSTLHMTSQLQRWSPCTSWKDLDCFSIQNSKVMHFEYLCHGLLLPACSPPSYIAQADWKGNIEVQWYTWLSKLWRFSCTFLDRRGNIICFQNILDPHHSIGRDTLRMWMEKKEKSERKKEDCRKL